VGSYAGLGGRRSADATVTAWSDVISAVPPFFLVMLLVAGPESVLLGPFANWSVAVFVVLFGFVLWPYYARIVRARAKQIAAEPYVEAARASGATPRRLLRRHVIPNSYPSVLAQIPADVANVLFVLAVFPFLHCFGGLNYPVLSPLPH
jgi:peptide/nickel transport system permease protein